MAASYRQLRSRGSQFGGRGRTVGFNSAGHRCGIEGGNPPQGGYYSLETKTTGRVTEFSIFQPEPEKHRQAKETEQEDSVCFGLAPSAPIE